MKVLVIDFWSDGNLGDAIMQCEILNQCEEFSDEIHIISCYGKNQFQLNAFNESLKNDKSTWHPGFFNTYVRLDDYSERYPNRKVRILKTLSALFFADLRLALYRVTKLDLFLGSLSRLKEIELDAIIFNGRNYRKFDGFIKNYINNRPLIIHQELVDLIAPDVCKINAGFSVWDMDKFTKKSVKNLWGKYKLNVARESSSFEFSKNNLNLENLCIYKDLSFSYLSRFSNLDKYNKLKNKEIGLILTPVENEDRYLDEINKVLKHFYELGYSITIIDQVYLQHESAKHLIDKILVPYDTFKTKSLERIINKYDSLDFLISTRMHGSIIGLSRAVPTASIAYDSGAKWSIIKDEINEYPIFRSSTFNSRELINYLLSDNSKAQADGFSLSIKNSKEKYVKKFLYDIDSNSK